MSPADLPDTDAIDAARAGTRVEHIAELAHATRGRVRLRLPAARRDPTVLDQVRAAFEGHPGIDAVSVGAAASCSLVIHYDPDHHPDLASLFRSLGSSGAPATLPPADAARQTRTVANALPATGAAHHGARTALDEEVDQIAEEAEFLAEHSTLARSIVESVNALDRQIKRSTNNTIDLKILAPVGLAAFTFLEIGALAATPMWVTLVIFSLNHFVELRAHAPGSPAPDAAAGKET